MKKSLPSLLLCLVCCWFNSQSQIPDWIWTKKINSGVTGLGEGNSIAVDSSENVYFSGFYRDTITFGSTVLTGISESVFLAKYDDAGNVLWARSDSNASPSSNAYCFFSCADAFGHCYQTGYFHDTVYFGSHALISVGSNNLFLVKYDSSGNVLWAKSSVGTGDERAFSVATDGTGNVYITGLYANAAFELGADSFPTAGSYDLFVAKFDSSGNVLWAKNAGGANADAGRTVAVDRSGNVYVGGYFESASLTFGTYVLANAGTYDIFLTKYDPSGNVIWARRDGGTYSDFGACIVTDNFANVYYAGDYGSSTIFTGAQQLISKGSYDDFLAKYDSTGKLLWTRNAGGTNVEYGYTITTDGNNKIYYDGLFLSNSITIDTITLTRPGGATDPMFIAAFDSLGKIQFAKVLSSGGDDQIGLGVDRYGCLYVGGDLETAPLIIGKDTLMLNGPGENAYLAKLCDLNLSAGFQSSASVICSENTNCVNFFDRSTGAVSNWHWSFPGANPDTSSLKNPVNICYGSAGTYSVSLTVSNSSGGDSVTVPSMIIVGSTPLPPTVAVVGGDTLISTHGSHYQWFLNGSPIGGATDSFYVAHQNGTYSVQITDQFGCHSQSAGTVITAISESNGVGIAVYPNPFQDKLNISGRSGALLLFDVTLRLLLQYSFTNQATINTGELAKGIYFYEVRDKNGVGARGKLVKQ